MEGIVMGRILGLDIGIASVGWCLLDTNTNKIVDIGVRLFESADASNNQQRRESRSARRNIRRKKYRLESIEDLLKHNNFFPPKDIALNPYLLRVKGLEQKLTSEEIYVALYHLAKRRGISYLDEVEEDDKNINNSLRINKELLKEKHPCEIQLERYKRYGKVRGIIETSDRENAEMLINVFTTNAYKKEAYAILKEQKKYYSQIDDEFIEEYIKILTRKREFYVGPGDKFNRTNYGIYKTDGTTSNSIFEELIGKCSIYPDEQRAPATSYTAQEFNLLNDLNNLVVEGRKLTENEKKKIISQVLDNTVKTFTSKRMINTIKNIANLENENQIKGYRIDKKENPEFHTFEAERKIKMFLKDTDIDYENFDIDKKDKLAEVLSKSPDFKSLKNNCNEPFPEFSTKDIEVLFSFLQNNKSLYSKWHSFSLKIMKEMREELYKSHKNQMNFLMEKGIKKSMENKFQGYKYIPVGFLDDEIYNPVVRRSVNQSIKIINAILKRYGELEAIIIEMPREDNEKDEKKRIQEIQKNNELEKNEALNRVRNEYPITEKQLYGQKGLISKIRLWYQQDGNCIYTGRAISIQDLVNNPNMFEIDHIIPKSISLDDSLNNKVLSYSIANQIKGQKTPFNAFSLNLNNISYEDIKKRASKLFENKKISKTKFDLLTIEEDINKFEIRQGFISRNLNDTRYASKIILNGLQEFMRENDKQTQIHVVRGKFTYQIRKKWGIEKDRDESFEHHAVDATIVAASYMLGQSEDTIRNPFLQKIGKYDKNLWKIISNRDYDRQVYRLPWEEFKKDLNNATKKIKYSHKIDTKVNRKISDATIYSTREIDGEHYRVEKYRNIYDDSIAKKVIAEIKRDINNFSNIEDSKILMRKHDPQTFEILYKIAEEYKEEKPNPFEAYRREHGYIRKYSKKGNGPIIKDIKYISKKVGEHIELNKTENLSKNKKVILLSLAHYRTDVYFNPQTGTYQNISINYSDLEYTNGRYLLKDELYTEMKNKFNIDEEYRFLFSLHNNDIIEIVSKEEPNIRNIFRFLSSRRNNPNKITIKPINRKEFNQQYPLIIGSKVYKSKEFTINRNVLEFNKYYIDILGNKFNVQGEKFKSEFIVDNINNM